MAASNDYDFLIKTVIVGDSGVGKSCLMKRFSDGVFFEEQTSTIGVDFEIRTIDINGKIAKLQLWDTAGQERFRNITTSYYRGANIIMIVFSVTDPQSFQSIARWMKEIENYASEDVQIIIVANKTDLASKRVVSTAAIQELAAPLGIPVIETSAKTSENVNKAFYTAAEEYIKRKSLYQKKKQNYPVGPSLPLDKSSTFNCCQIL